MITFLIILINVGWFVFGTKIGLNISNYTEISTQILSPFSHADWMHLIMNMVALLLIGGHLESIIGKTKFLFVYILSTIFGNIFSVYMILNYLNPNVFVIGASGAIFGIWMVESYFSKTLESFFGNVIFFHSLVFILKLHIAWYSHFGGILAGMLCILFLRKNTELTYVSFKEKIILMFKNIRQLYYLSE